MTTSLHACFVGLVLASISHLLPSDLGVAQLLRCRLLHPQPRLGPADVSLAKLRSLGPSCIEVLHVCRRGDDLFAAGGALGLGVSLYFIHIYVTPLKRFVQVQHACLAIALLSTCKFAVSHVTEVFADVRLHCCRHCGQLAV